ncbi:MAG: hypothetical protein AAES65_09675 [Candidatus Thiodiazotropha sp. (ex. Lucinoma kazani)]
MPLRIESRGTPEQQVNYRRSIERVLAGVQRTHVGRIVIRHINRSDRTVMIVPYTGRGVNAAAVPGNNAASGTFSRTRVARGTNSRVLFSVDRSVMPDVPQGTADEVLLHELAHALRQINGVVRWARDTTGARVPLRMASFGSVDEFFAAMVASVHSSELRRPVLGNHGVWELRNPDVLLQRPYSTRLRDFWERMPVIAAEIGAIPANVAAFNPFRDVPH